MAFFSTRKNSNVAQSICRTTLAALTALALLTLCAATPAAAANYAVVAGTSQFKNLPQSNWLVSADADARSISSALAADTHWPSANVQLLTNAQASKAGLQAAIAAMAARAGSGDTCLFYYSGHGTTDGTHEYICPSDVSNSSAAILYSTSIRDDELAGWLSAVKGQVIVMLDTCYSGGMLGSTATSSLASSSAAGTKAVRIKCLNPKAKAVPAGRGFHAELVKLRAAKVAARAAEKAAPGKAAGTTTTAALDGLPLVVALSASASTEESYELDTAPFNHGLFTFYVLEAMQSPLTDSNSSGDIAVEEVYAYISPRVSSYWLDSSQYRQHPQLLDDIAGDVTLVNDPTGLPATVFASNSFDTNPGWTAGSAWAWGTPQGHGGGSTAGGPDPTAGHSGAPVYGNNLAGNYALKMSVENSLTSSAFNCSNYNNIHLRFWRWLGANGADWARLYVSNDNAKWTQVWVNPVFSISDTQWTQYDYNISAVASGKSAVYLRWGLGPTYSGPAFCGWNIDDVALVGDYVTPPVPTPAIGLGLTKLTPTCTQGSDATSQTFQVWNSGQSTLNYTVSTNVSWLSVSPTSGTSTGTGNQQTHTVTYATAGLTAGTYPATITISAAGASNSPQTIAVTLTVSPVPSTMVVEGNGQFITSGDTTASLADYTDFGAASTVPSGSVTRTFTIVNNGTAPLNLTGNPDLVTISGTNATDFTVLAQPTTPLAANGGTTTFQVQFVPQATGLRTATVSVANDSGFGTFTFAIQGTGQGQIATNTNNTDSAHALDLGTISGVFNLPSGMSLPSGNEEQWYKFTLAKAGNSNSKVEVLFTATSQSYHHHPNQNIDAVLFDLFHYYPIRWGSFEPNGLVVPLRLLPAGRVYYLCVYGNNWTSTSYNLRITTP
jgi:uncharacterized caspase-like protein